MSRAAKGVVLGLLTAWIGLLAAIIPFTSRLELCLAFQIEGSPRGA